MVKRWVAAAGVLAALLVGSASATVTGTSSRQEYTAAGGAQVTFNFPVTSSSQLEVFLAGVKQSSGYVVALNSGGANGGTVTFTPVPAAGTLIRVQRTLPLTQSVSLPVASPFKAKVIERAFDDVVWQVQQVERYIGDEGSAWRAGDSVLAAAHAADKSAQATIDAGQNTRLSEHDSVMALAEQVALAKTGPAGPPGASGEGPAFGNPGFVQYVRPGGSDASSGLSWTAAKQTILAAYDALGTQGGTIYIAEGSYVGGEVANQGIWLMGFQDPQCGYDAQTRQCETLPPGWRQVRSVSFVGVSDRSWQFLRDPAASIIGGQPGGTGWAHADPNKPGIWISGEESRMSFRNLVVIGPARPIALSVPSNRDYSGGITWVAALEFENVAAIVYTDTGDDAIPERGPAVEIHYTFWTYFKRCYFGGFGVRSLVGYAPHGLTAEQRGAAVLVRFGGPGNFEHSVLAGGGIRVTGKDALGNAQPNWGVVRDIIIEGDYENPVPPAIEWEYMDGYGSVILENITAADAPGSGATVKIPASTDANRGRNPGQVIAWGVDKIEGAATILNHASREGYHDLTATPSAHGQIGMLEGRLWGPHDGARRNAGATPARFDNLLTAVPASGIGGDNYGQATVTPGIEDPLGSNEAWRLTTEYAGRDSFKLGTATVPVAVGDRIVGGAWMRVRTAGGAAPNTAFLDVPSIVVEAPGMTLSPNAGGALAVATFPFYGDGEWEWVAVDTAITSTNGNSTSAISLGAWFTPERAVDVYAPTLLKVPAALTANEYGEFLTHFTALPLGAKATRTYAPQGHDLVVTDPTKGLMVYSPDGNPWRLTMSAYGVPTWTKYGDNLIWMDSENLSDAGWYYASITVTNDQCTLPGAGSATMDRITSGGNYSYMHGWIDGDKQPTGTGPFTASAWVAATSGTVDMSVGGSCGNGIDPTPVSCARSDGGTCTTVVDADRAWARAMAVTTAPVRLSVTYTCATPVVNPWTDPTVELLNLAFAPGAYPASETYAGCVGGVQLENGALGAYDPVP